MSKVRAFIERCRVFKRLAALETKARNADHARAIITGNVAEHEARFRRMAPCWLCGAVHHHVREANPEVDHDASNRLELWAQTDEVRHITNPRRGDWSKAQVVPVCGGCRTRAKHRRDMQPVGWWRQWVREHEAAKVEANEVES